MNSPGGNKIEKRLEKRHADFERYKESALAAVSKALMSRGIKENDAQEMLDKFIRLGELQAEIKMVRSLYLASQTEDEPIIAAGLYRACALIMPD